MIGLRSASPASRWKKAGLLPHVALWTIGFAFFALFWQHNVTQVRGDLDRTLISTERDLANLTRLTQEHTERVFRHTDQSLKMVRRQFARHSGDIDLQEAFAQGLVDPETVHQLSIIGPDGLLAKSSLPFKPPLDLSDREHFKVHVGTHADVLFISKPILGRASGKWSIQLSRRITDQHGSFMGAVVASLDPSYFTQFFANLDLGDRGVSTIYSVEGDLLAQRNSGKDLFDGASTEGLNFRGIDQGRRNGLIKAHSAGDGVQRTYFFRKVDNFPLVVTIGLADDDLLVDHRERAHHLYRQGAFASMLGFLVLALLSAYLFFRQRQIDDQANALSLLQNLTSRLPGAAFKMLHRRDNTHSFPFASAGMREVYGLDPQDLAADSSAVFDRIHPDDRDDVVKTVIQAAKYLRPWGQDYRVCFDNGEVRWLRAEATPRAALDGDVIWYGYVQDVTERIEQANALAAEQANMQATFEAIPDLLFEVDGQGKILNYHSPRTDLLAAPPDAFLGKLMDDFIPPSASALIRGAMDEAALTGFSNGTQYALLLPHGERWFELSVARKERRAGSKDRFIMLARDITDRKKAEAELRIASIAFESQEGMFVTDATSTILRVNKAFTRITGYNEAEAVGRKPSLLSSGRHDAAFYAVMRAEIEASKVWQGEVWNRRKNGEIYPEWLTITAVLDSAGTTTHYVSTLTDITTRKAAEEQIQHLAFYDPLTGLPNRRLLMDRLTQVMASCARHKRHGAIIFIDLDNFKSINDVHGHNVGDLMLQQVAQRLSDNIREGDTVARIGGDEYVVMLDELKELPDEAAMQAKAAGEKILAALRRPFTLRQMVHHSTGSLGIALIGENLESAEELLKRADLALYEAKGAGKDTLRFFDPEMQKVVTARAHLESRLRTAVERNELALFYQPQADGQGHLVGVEALLRWSDPVHGIVSPASFIALAEETGLILPLGAWVFETACAQLSDWARQAHTAKLTVAVNVSARQFLSENFVSDVLSVLARTGAPPSRLKLELTESLLVHDIEKVIEKMLMLKSHHVAFSLDDFGTGFASLNYLRRLPLDQLKIDQSFLREAITNPKDAAIVRSIVALGQALGLMVIAEGVETLAQRDFLYSEGCGFFQGYYFGRPGPVNDLDELIARLPA